MNKKFLTHVMDFDKIYFCLCYLKENIHFDSDIFSRSLVVDIVNKFSIY